MILFLILTDVIVLGLVKNHPLADFDSAYQFPQSSVLGVNNYLGYIRESSHGVKVVFLGDSTVGGFLEGFQTALPFFYEQQWKERNEAVKVYNLGLSAARPADMYLLLKEIIDEFDFVIIGVHFRFFLRRDLESGALAYPDLIRFLPSITKADVSQLGQGEMIPSFLARQIDRLLFNYWQFYRWRGLLKLILFKGEPRDFLFNQYKNMLQWLRTGQRQNGKVQFGKAIPFDELSEDEKEFNVNYAREYYRFVGIDDGNPSLIYLNKIADLLAAKKKKAFIYMVPLSRDLLDKYQLMDWEQYQSLVMRIKALINSDDTKFVDYNDNSLLARQYYYNFDHLTKQGNEQFAHILFKDTALTR